MTLPAAFRVPGSFGAALRSRLLWFKATFKERKEGWNLNTKEMYLGLLAPAWATHGAGWAAETSTTTVHTTPCPLSIGQEDGSILWLPTFPSSVTMLGSAVSRRFGFPNVHKHSSVISWF